MINFRLSSTVLRHFKSSFQRQQAFGLFGLARINRGIHTLSAEHLKITEKCKENINNKLVPKKKHLRLAVKGGEGCDGFTYEFIAEDESKLEDAD